MKAWRLHLGMWHRGLKVYQVSSNGDPTFDLFIAKVKFSSLCIYMGKIMKFLLLNVLTLKVPRKSASENVVCLCRLLHLLANFSNLHFAYRQTVWTQIRLLLKNEQSDLGPHCLQK